VGAHLRDFDRQLEAIEAEVTGLFAMVCDDLPGVTAALLNGHHEAAGQLAEREQAINALYGEIEHVVSRAILLWAPVASDLRFLLSAPQPGGLFLVRPIGGFCRLNGAVARMTQVMAGALIGGVAAWMESLLHRKSDGRLPDDSAEPLGAERGIIAEVEVDVTLERAIGVERGPAATAHVVAPQSLATRTRRPACHHDRRRGSRVLPPPR
jgi:hypothetical protein